MPQYPAASKGHSVSFRSTIYPLPGIRKQLAGGGSIDATDTNYPRKRLYNGAWGITVPETHLRLLAGRTVYGWSPVHGSRR